MSSLKQTFANFEMALDALQKSLVPPPTEDRDFAGIIQSFEFTYELCWKSLKLILEENGVAAPFPRVCFEEAFKRDIIAGNQIWKEIIEARNLSVHTYDKILARKLCGDIQTKYLRAFEDSRALMRGFVP